MNVKPVRSDRLSDKVARQFIEMMREGSLQPGEKLPNEQLLAEQFGVSRGILREALTQLQAQGFIRRKPKDGTYIQDDVQGLLMNHSVNAILKKATYVDLLDFREMLELRMVERVIERASDEEIEELFEGLNVAEDDAEQRDMDIYFHYKLAQASHNIFFMDFIDTYYDLLSEIANKSQRDQVRRNQIAQEHTAIAKAVANRNKEEARKAVRYHMRMVDRKIESMRENEEL